MNFMQRIQVKRAWLKPHDAMQRLGVSRQELKSSSDVLRYDLLQKGIRVHIRTNGLTWLQNIASATAGQRKGPILLHHNARPYKKETWEKVESMKFRHREHSPT